MEMTDVVLTIVAALLLASGAMVTIRLVRGPSTLDRAVALDALVAVMMAGIAINTAAQRVGYYLPVLLVLSFLGFTGSVGVARFMALRDEAGGGNVDTGADTGTAPDTVAEAVPHLAPDSAATTDTTAPEGGASGEPPGDAGGTR